MKFRKDIVVGKCILSYRDGELSCKFVDYEPFFFYKTCRVQDIYENKEYQYILLKKLSGEFVFGSSNNKVVFPNSQEAFVFLDKIRKYYKEDRDYYLGL